MIFFEYPNHQGSQNSCLNSLWLYKQYISDIDCNNILTVLLFSFVNMLLILLKTCFSVSSFSSPTVANSTYLLLFSGANFLYFSAASLLKEGIPCFKLFLPSKTMK